MEIKKGGLFSIIIALGLLCLMERKKNMDLCAELDELEEVLYEAKESIKEARHEIRSACVEGGPNSNPNPDFEIKGGFPTGGVSKDGFTNWINETKPPVEDKGDWVQVGSRSGVPIWRFYYNSDVTYLKLMGKA